MKNNFISIFLKLKKGEMMQNQSSEKLIKFRNCFYDLLINQVPADVIIKEIAKQVICKKRNKNLTLKINKAVCDILSLMKDADKKIIYLESFSCTIMCILNNQ